MYFPPLLSCFSLVSMFYNAKMNLTDKNVLCGCCVNMFLYVLRW